MTFGDNVSIAWTSIRSSRQRSFLTMLGIIVSVASVITITSIGEGIRQQAGKQANELGANLVSVLPGKVSEGENALNRARTFFQRSATAPLTDADYKAASGAKVAGIVPFAKVTGEASSAQNAYEASIVGVTSKAFAMLNYKVEYGSVFDDSQASRGSAVIGKGVAEKLFNENVPVGKILKVRDQEFIVRGVLAGIAPHRQLINGIAAHDNTIFIHYDVAQILMGGYAPLYQIVAETPEGGSPEELAKDLREKIQQSRAGETDFSVLTQTQINNLLDANLSLATLLIYLLAIIVAVTGGVGIMNVMLVIVAERTREIGIRKAVGATSLQILRQFIIEAALLSFSGGIIGSLLAIASTMILRVVTDLQPVITFDSILLSILAVSILGVVFGAAPSYQAAKKDPIDALRY